MSVYLSSNTTFNGTDGSNKESEIVASIDENTSNLPTTRPDGAPLHNGDEVRIQPTATTPFTIDGITIKNNDNVLHYFSGDWFLSYGNTIDTTEIAVANPATESADGQQTNQSGINVLNVATINAKLNKNQGVANAGSLLVVGQDGNITFKTPQQQYDEHPMTKIGAYYIQYDANTNPNNNLPSGVVATWELQTETTGRALWNKSDETPGTTITQGLPNITGEISLRVGAGLSYGFVSNSLGELSNGAFYSDGAGTFQGIVQSGGANACSPWKLSAQKSNPIYGASNKVQPNALVINIWKRIS